MLLGRGKKCDKFVGRRAKVTNATVGGERADMEKNAGRTLKLHTSIMEWN